MRYENITRGIFIDRPNRLVANVEIEGKILLWSVREVVLGAVYRREYEMIRATKG